jgi:hypothetical protein
VSSGLAPELRPPVDDGGGGAGIYHLVHPSPCTGTVGPVAPDTVVRMVVHDVAILQVRIRKVREDGRAADRPLRCHDPWSGA